MSKKDKKSEKQKKPKKEIYILQSTYKQGDPEMVGAYDSMRAMMRGFAKLIADEILGYPENGGVEQKIAHEVAKTLADLIPAFFDHDYPRDGEGYIRYGKTTYGYDTMPVEGVDEDEEDDEENENEEVEED